MVLFALINPSFPFLNVSNKYNTELIELQFYSLGRKPAFFNINNRHQNKEF